MDTKPAALKEWAVTIKALLEGKQILIMRKGGIVEETRDFQLENQSFYLYPTYEHQKKELMKEEHQAAIDETLKGWSAEVKDVAVEAYAEVAEDIEVHDQEELNRLSGLHVWTDRFAEERLKWKRKNPLHVLLLRVYRLESPLRIPILEDYLGCKSWIRIGTELPAVAKSPVLDGEAFALQREAIHRALGRSQ